MSGSSSIPRVSCPQDRIGAFMRHRPWLRFALLLAGATVIALFFAIQSHIAHGADEPTVGWRRLITSDLGCWYAWAAIFPLVWWLARRFPLESPRLGRGLAVHLTAMIVVTAVQPWLMAGMVWTIRGFFDPFVL